MKKDNKKPNKNNIYLIVLCVMLVVAMAITVSMYFMNKDKDKEESVSYTQLLKDIDEEKVEKIEMTIGSTRLKVIYKERENEEDSEKVIIPNTQAFVEYVQGKVEEGKSVELAPKTSGFFAMLSNNFLSIISTTLMIVVVVMIFKMQGLGDKGKIYDGVDNKTNVKFEDVAGLKEEKQEI